MILREDSDATDTTKADYIDTREDSDTTREDSDTTREDSATTRQYDLWYINSYITIIIVII